MFSFGIEHEVAFLNPEGKLAEFSRTKFADFDQIIEKLPLYPSDYSQLRVGDEGIRKKRWYIEGYERFSESGKFIECVPKGIEIRTTIHSDIQSTISELFLSLNRPSMIMNSDAYGLPLKNELITFPCSLMGQT